MFVSNFDSVDCPKEMLVSMIRDLLENNLRLERERITEAAWRDISYQQWKAIVREHAKHGLKYETILGISNSE